MRQRRRSNGNGNGHGHRPGYYRKRIAPHLANGDFRVRAGHRLPPQVKEGLNRIAYKEGQSQSWVIEQVLIDYFGLKRPEYRTPSTWDVSAPKEVEAMYHVHQPERRRA